MPAAGNSLGGGSHPCAEAGPLLPLSQSVVAYDHARHAQLGEVITLDFITARTSALVRRATTSGSSPFIQIVQRRNGTYAALGC
jgi:hypothetical protein